MRMLEYGENFDVRPIVKFNNKNYDFLYTCEFADKLLQKAGFSLIQMDDGRDSYLLFIVTLEDREKLAPYYGKDIGEECEILVFN